LGDADVDTERFKDRTVSAALKANNFSEKALTASFDDVDATYAAMKNVF
jgi:hypothetical protein